MAKSKSVRKKASKPARGSRKKASAKKATARSRKPVRASKAKAKTKAKTKAKAKAKAKAQPARKASSRPRKAAAKARKKPASRRKAARTKPARTKRAASASTSVRRAARAKKRPTAVKSSRQPAAVTGRAASDSTEATWAGAAIPLLRRRRRERGLPDDMAARPRGTGSDSGGQAGDTEGLSREESAASESVEELVEEGQSFEAGIIDGIENAPDADQGGIRTREVLEDDVPEEYLDEDSLPPGSR